MAFNTIPGIVGTDFTTLVGTELADVINIQTSHLFIDAREGSDTIKAATRVEEIIIDSGQSNDNVFFTADIKAKVSLDNGNDQVTLSDFSGSIYGGTGNDTVIQTSVNRVITNTLIRGTVEMNI